MLLGLQSGCKLRCDLKVGSLARRFSRGKARAGDYASNCRVTFLESHATWREPAALQGEIVVPSDNLTRVRVSNVIWQPTGREQ
jgi:hypothetical protein